jgi:hypothetical protein
MEEKLTTGTSPPPEWGPLDYDQMHRLGSMSPAQRIYKMLEAQEFSMNVIRGRLRLRYPGLSQREINLKVFEEIDRYELFEIVSGELLSAWFANPQDAIINRLMAWTERPARRHEREIHAMLSYIYLSADPELSNTFNQADVDAQVATLGAEVNQLWEYLKETARLEADGAS